MPEASPFAALSLIVAPAILTNAASVLAMSTSNRLARAVDRARDLSRQLEADKASEDTASRRLRDLGVVEDRTVLLMRALRSFYSALGAFAVATLLSLIGAVVSRTGTNEFVRALEVVALTSGGVAVGAIVHGATLLLRETGLAVKVLQERAESLRARRPIR
jgi:methyl coenzyme M reductase gamma subunit